MDAYGQIDELNAAIGLAAVAWPDENRLAELRDIQRDLFVLGTQLATPDGQPPHITINGDDITRLERWIDAADKPVPPLRDFLLPGPTESAARFHLARSVCRRCERVVACLVRDGRVDRVVGVYLNRLGDLLFAYARLVNHEASVGDIVWKNRKPSGTDD